MKDITYYVLVDTCGRFTSAASEFEIVADNLTLEEAISLADEYVEVSEVHICVNY